MGDIEVSACECERIHVARKTRSPRATCFELHKPDIGTNATIRKSGLNVIQGTRVTLWAAGVSLGAPEPPCFVGWGWQGLPCGVSNGLCVRAVGRRGGKGSL